MSIPTPVDLRDQLTDMVVRDLLGLAGGPEEELHPYEDHFDQRNLVGMLALNHPRHALKVPITPQTEHRRLPC